MVFGYLIIINLVTYYVYAHDKRNARFGVWRVKEIHLLLLAFFGGSLAAIYAMKKLRHKTKKKSFRMKFALVLVMQFTAAVYVAVTQL